MKKVISVLLVMMLAFSFGSVNSYALDTSSPFRVSCTVKGDTSTSRGFCWYTDNNCGTEIRLFKDGSEVTSDVAISDVQCKKWKDYYMHKLTVSGLEAGTSYTYKVGDGSDMSAEGRFTTDDKNSQVAILAYADVQASSQENFDKSANAVSKGLEYISNPDLMINLGDFTNDCDNEQWNYYAEAFDSLDMSGTLVPVAGNHDGLGKYQWFENMFNLDESESVQNLNGVNYSFDCGNIHFSVLNTNDLFSVSDAQIKWLEKDLASTSATWKIVAMHKSPYTLGKDGKWPDAYYLRSTVVDVCDEYGVDLVISGHDHQYLRTKPLKNSEVNEAGSVYVLCGTAGSKRYAVRPFMVENYISTSLIETMVSQNDGKYFNGSDFDSVNEDYQGSCFNTIKVNGGELTFESYIVPDNGNDTVKIDSFTLNKEESTADSIPTDNSTSTASYLATAVPSLVKFIFSSLFRWLPKFIGAAPEIAKSYFNDGIF